MPKHRKKINAVFYKTEAGAEPVRDWLHSLSKDDRFKIGSDIMTVEFGWPVGMPTCRGFIKKAQKTPDLDLARQRKRDLEN